MKTLKTVVLVALLVASSHAGECGAGYEKQFMDDNSRGYCTRIPSLQEQADRAEAFLEHGLPKMLHYCRMMHRDSTPADFRQEYLSNWQIMATTVDMMRLAPFVDVKGVDAVAFNKIALSPEGKRIIAAVDTIQKQGITNCKNEK